MWVRIRMCNISPGLRGRHRMRHNVRQPDSQRGIACEALMGFSSARCAHVRRRWVWFGSPVTNAYIPMYMLTPTHTHTDSFSSSACGRAQEKCMQSTENVWYDTNWCTFIRITNYHPCFLTHSNTHVHTYTFTHAFFIWWRGFRMYL